MTQQLYIAIYRTSPTSPWQALNDGLFPESRLAENLIECKIASGWKFDMAIVSGSVVPVQTPTEIEAILGAF